MTNKPPQQRRVSAAASQRAVAWIRDKPLLAAAIFAGVAVRIVYWAVTDRRLDDALITIKHAVNVADGAGFTHHLGEDGPVHGFTSALSALVPLPGELIAHGGGLLTLRLVSLVAFVVAAVYAYRIARELGLGPWPTGFVLSYLALDLNQIFYGVAGMETQIAVAILLAGVHSVLVADFTKSGIWLGLALLARPDFALWVGPALVFLLIRSRDGVARTWLIMAAIVAPWVIFATLYYGSPVPNPIVAKSQAFLPDYPSLTDPGAVLDFAWTLLRSHQDDWMTIAPFLSHGGPIGTPLAFGLLKAIAWIVGALAIVGACVTWRRPSWRPAIVFVLLWIAYKIVFLTVGYFEWYGVPALALIFILAGAGLDRVLGWHPKVVAVAAVALAGVYAMHIPYSLPIERSIQKDIEEPVRDRLGRYLGEVLEPGETFVTEPAGYFGFYTNATMLDFPGLTSTRVTDALADNPGLAPLAGQVELLRPDWLVLRPNELELVELFYPETAQQYREVRRFVVSEQETELSVGGLTIPNFDREFIVLRREAS